LQAYAPHELVVPPWLQLPPPSQVFAVVCMSAAHVGAAHVVPLGQSSQAPLWQRPSVPQVDCAVIMHAVWFIGEAIPLRDGLHVPEPPPPACWSDAAHAVHAPVHALLQQKPSAQKPLEH
jgi:hypothetical protein